MASAICVEAADEGFGMGRGADAVEVKDVASVDRVCGMNGDSFVWRASGVLQAQGATAIGGDGIRAVGKLQGENPGAHVDVLKTTGNMAAPVRSEAAGSREKARR